MMKKKVWPGLLLLLIGFTACQNNARKNEIRALMIDKDSGIVQHKVILGTQMQLMYMPRYWHRMEEQPVASESADSSEMDFRLTVNVPNDGKTHNTTAAAYGIDSLFVLILDQDTLNPVFAQQIQDGHMHGIKYLVGFERPPLQNILTAKLVFKDHLFTNNRIAFPLAIPAIIKIDSLSARL